MPTEPSTNSIALVDEMQRILERVFLQGERPLSLPAPDLTARFLLAGKMARENGRRDFEQTLLLTGKACDERCKDSVRDEICEYFLELVAHIRLYEETQEQINRLAIMKSVSIDAEMISSLYRNRLVFDQLEESLFEQLFLSDLLSSRFIGSYGRLKVKTLAEGLKRLSAGTTTAAAIRDSLNLLEKEQKLLMNILDNIRDNLRNNYSGFASKNDLEILKRILTIDLRHKNLLQDEVPEELFSKGIAIIKKEAIYYNNLLPLIIQTGNRALREEFIAESGLDLFFIEEIEYDYCDAAQIPRERLALVR